MIKWLIRILILAIAIIVAFALLVDTIATEIAESYLSKKLGAEVSIEKVDVGLTLPRVKVYNFVLYNPTRFGGSRFIEIPEATIEYDFNQALKLNAFFKLVRIECSTINIVSDKFNKLNLEDFFTNKSNPSRQQGRNNATFFIETLNLSVGVVKWTSIEKPTQVQEVPINLRNYIIKGLSSKDLTSQFFNNLLIQIMLQSGKIGIKDGKLIILQSDRQFKK